MKNTPLMDEIEDLTSPVTKRSISQTIKVINAIIDKYGSPSDIFVETGRDMKKTFNERREIMQAQKENMAENERIKQRLINEFGVINPTGQDIVKLKLYDEQGGKCAYSQKSFEDVFGKTSAIFSNNNTQIDHIIPYSLSFNDSYNNKVLVLSEENQNKGMQLPYQYLAHKEDRWEKFCDFVNATYKNRRKRDNLLKKEITEDEIRGWKENALNDTSHIAKFVGNMLRKYLEFDTDRENKKTVHMTNGTMTSFLRKIWGLNKNREENDKHHAQDAVVIACCSDTAVKRITQYYKGKSYHKNKKDGDDFRYINMETGEVFTEEQYQELNLADMLMPYVYFVEEVKARMNLDENQDLLNTLIRIGYTKEELNDAKPIFVSRMPNRKLRGAIHKETVRAVKGEREDGLLITYTKTPLTSLKLENGEIKGYAEEAKRSDTLLYNALKQRLIEFNGDAKKAFAEPFHKPKKDGTPGPIVRSVKLQDSINDGVILQTKEMNGEIIPISIAENGEIVRTDFYRKNGKYYAVPVYTKDAYAGVLPKRIIKANGGEVVLGLDDILNKSIN